MTSPHLSSTPQEVVQSPLGGRIHRASALRSRWNPPSVVDTNALAGLVQRLRPDVPPNTFCGMPASISDSFRTMVRRVHHQAEEWARAATIRSESRVPLRGSTCSGNVDGEQEPRRSSLLASEVAEREVVRDALFEYGEASFPSDAGEVTTELETRVLTAVTLSWLDWALRTADAAPTQTVGQEHTHRENAIDDLSAGGRGHRQKRLREECEESSGSNRSNPMVVPHPFSGESVGLDPSHCEEAKNAPSPLEMSAYAHRVAADVLRKRRQLLYPEEELSDVPEPQTLETVDTAITLHVAHRCSKRLRAAVQKERRLLKGFSTDNVTLRNATAMGHAKQPSAAPYTSDRPASEATDDDVPLIRAVEAQTASVVAARDRFAAAHARFSNAMREMQLAAEDAIYEADGVAEEERCLGDLLEGVAKECEAVNELRLLLVRVLKDMKQQRPS